MNSRALGLDYVDLYLIHYPVQLKGEKTMIFSKEAIIPVEIPSVWEGMERCQSLGLAKSIGVSNFTSKKIVDLLEHAKISPAVNQVYDLCLLTDFVPALYLFLKRRQESFRGSCITLLMRLSF